jgi:hypothetical protein
MTNKKPPANKGQFQPGVSGNPGGRSGKTRELREKLAEGAEGIIEIVLKAAQGGDMQACRLVLERLVPAVKPAAQVLNFPLDQSDLPAAARSILAAVAAGEVPPDQGNLLITAVLGMARVIEVSELEKQLAELRTLLEARK